MRIETSNVTVWGLLALLAVPVSAGERRQKTLSWEAFVQLEPGTAVELALADGQRFAGRLLAANAHEARVIDFTGRGFSERAQQRFVRELIEARREPPAAVAADSQATATAEADAPLVRRVTPDQVAAVYVPRGDGSPGLRLLKIGTILAGAYYLVLWLVYLAVGGIGA